MADKIAAIGAGLVGCGWAIVFARAGFQVALYDESAEALRRAPTHLANCLKDLEAAGLIESAAAVLGRITVENALADTVRGARYVQESIFEDVQVKHRLFGVLDALLDEHTLAGSSTSAIPPSQLTEDLKTRERWLVAHPVNPPYLVPLVELVPAPWTATATVDAVRALMTQAGQAPVLVKRELEGFVLNRLQGALLNEAWKLVEEDYISVEDLDKTISDGLGLRWSFMGPFETIDLNAPNGVRDYAERFGPFYHRVANSRPTPQPAWSETLISQVESVRREQLPAEQLDSRRAWRDRRLMALVRHKHEMNGGPA
ncbi:3-hydroxyacyl-CoA dehydrogenase [bacterium]|nr:MAG: 3-hydroxyacyl-CoA dehydrogenase [bacterium]